MARGSLSRKQAVPREAASEGSGKGFEPLPVESLPPEPDNKGYREWRDAPLAYKLKELRGQIEQMTLGEYNKVKEEMDISKGSKFAVEAAYMKELERILETQKNPNWKPKDDMRDPNSKYNLNKLVEEIRFKPVEYSYNFDKDGRFMGVAKGNANSVTAIAVQGSLRGGYSIHNHPTGPDRPLGHPPSPGDIRTSAFSGRASEVITAREGVYAYSHGAKSNIKPWMVDNYDAKSQIAFKTARAEVIAGGGNPDNKNHIAAAEHYAINRAFKELCAEAGIKYKFAPAKGFEYLTADSIDYSKIP